MEFSTLMFLKEIQKSKLRRIRIKQLLLLILRIIIIILIVLAFSNPVYKGYLSGNNPDIRKCGIFILDNSFSMNAKDDKGSYFEQAKNSIQNILKLYGSNDKVHLITSSHLKEFEKGESKDINSLIDSIKTLEITYTPFDLSNLLKYADNICKNDNFPLYEIFVISDFQKINLSTENNIVDLFVENNKKIHIYNIDIGKRVANNISVEKTEIKSKILEINKDIRISVILKNHNNFNTLNKQVNFIIGNKKVTEAVVDIASLERKEVVLTFKPVQTGSNAGYIELLQNDFFEDEIVQDNKSYFAFTIPEKVNVGLVSDNEYSIKYIKLAIESAEKINEKEKVNNFYNIISSSVLKGDVMNSDMLIISGKNSFSADDINLLTDYINGGNGVLIFPGRNIDTKSYNTLFGSLNTFRIDDISKLNVDSIVNKKFEKIDFEHPIFSGVFKNENLNITGDKYFVESPKINFIYNIIPNNNCTQIMLLSGSKIFLAESGSGEGKIMFSAVSADEEMSNFSRTSLFPLIINKCIFYLGKGEYKNQNNITGKNNIISFGRNKVYSVPYNLNYKGHGIYTIKDSSENKNYFFCLNRDSLESDFQKADLKDIKEFYKIQNLKNVEYIQEQNDINSVILKSRNGIELWKYLIVLALIFVIIEMVYSKKLEKI